MMARRGVLSVLAGAGTFVLSGCGAKRTMRYKMTVEVQAPDGLKSGFAVREVLYPSSTDGWFPFGESKGYPTLIGEAVAVDIASGKTLFALLTSGDAMPDYAARDIVSLFRQLNTDEVQLWPNPPKVRAPIIRNPLPMLVTFNDISDPTSIQRLEPERLVDSFGAGVQLKRIMIEKTNEETTVAIVKRLEWLLDKNRKRFSSDKKPDGIPIGNYTGLFSAELGK
jgi:hypothetical protein